ncbi:MAG: Ig-like domain-containing protein [Clostridia bacterium]|nr:Ig-like domain-containing protein [Clostridia bacterium]
MLKKKFVCAALSAAMLFTAVSGLTAFANPLVLDTADASGIMLTDGGSQSVSTSSGVWNLTNGISGKAPGYVQTDGNSNRLRFFKSAGSITRELSAKYTSNKAQKDTAVKFVYQTDNITLDSQIIQVSSGTVLSSQPAYDSSVLAGDGLSGVVKYNNDGAVVKALGDKLYYLNPTSGQLVQVQGVTVAVDTMYYLKFEPASNNTYNLYVDTANITSNSTPKATAIPLISPTGAGFSQAAMWVGRQVQGGYNAKFGDIEFTKEISAGAPDSIYSEDFSGDTLDSSWSTYFGKTATQGEVSINDSALRVKFHGNTTRASYATKDITGMDNYDSISVAFDFQMNESTTTNEKSIVIASNNMAGTKTAKTFVDNKNVQTYGNSVHIVTYGGKLYYADASLDGTAGYFTELMPISNDTTYYVKADIDNINHTFDLYISTSAITDQTTPVVQNKTLFNNTNVAPKSFGASVQMLQANDNTDRILYIDNIDVSTTYPASAFPSVGTVSYSASGALQNSSAVSVNTDTITIPFTTDMSKVSAYVADESGKNISATGALSGDTYTITLANALDYSKTYTVHVGSTATSTAGIQLGSEYVETFTTEDEPVENSEWIAEADGVVTDNGDGTYSKAFNLEAGVADGYNSLIIQKADNSLLGASFSFLDIKEQLSAIGNSPFGLVIDNLPDASAIKIMFTSVDLND